MHVVMVQGLKVDMRGGIVLWCAGGLQQMLMLPDEHPLF